jgi:hypothetical protein
MNIKVLDSTYLKKPLRKQEFSEVKNTVIAKEFIQRSH